MSLRSQARFAILKDYLTNNSRSRDFLQHQGFCFFFRFLRISTVRLSPFIGVVSEFAHWSLFFFVKFSGQSNTPRDSAIVPRFYTLAMDYSPDISGQLYNMTSEQSLHQLQELIQRIANAETDDFFELAKLAGLSPVEDFSGAVLRNVDLRSAVLARANFINTDLSGAILINTNLEEARLIGAHLVLAVLTGAKLDYAKLVSADLTDANLVGASLSNADLTRAILAGADLSHADMRRANLTAATLCGACLCEVTLSHANLRRSDLSGTDLSGATLFGADLSNSDLRMADLSETNLVGTTVVRALFGANPGLSRETMLDLSSRGAAFYTY